MNIFVLDENPIVSAQYLCDKHMKMALESAQILCTVAHKYGYIAPYKQTHTKHKCTIWAEKSYSNYKWLFLHGMAICLEYTKRYGKKHKSQDIIEWCARNVVFPDIGITEFAQAMPDKYKNKNAVIAYRNYYIGEKIYFAKWKYPATPPEWWPYDEKEQKRFNELKKLERQNLRNKKLSTKTKA